MRKEDWKDMCERRRRGIVRGEKAGAEIALRISWFRCVRFQNDMGTADGAYRGMGRYEMEGGG